MFRTTAVQKTRLHQFYRAAGGLSFRPSTAIIGTRRVAVRCLSLVLACWIIVPGSACLYGQQGSIAGPSSGFAFDQSARVLRQIRGIPGASIIGEPVDFGLSLAA